MAQTITIAFVVEGDTEAEAAKWLADNLPATACFTEGETPLESWTMLTKASAEAAGQEWSLPFDAYRLVDGYEPGTRPFLKGERVVMRDHLDFPGEVRDVFTYPDGRPSVEVSLDEITDSTEREKHPDELVHVVDLMVRE